MTKKYNLVLAVPVSLCRRRYISVTQPVAAQCTCTAMRDTGTARVKSFVVDECNSSTTKLHVYHKGLSTHMSTTDKSQTLAVHVQFVDFTVD